MPRTDGRKLVALATTATLAAIGVGTIYLPFMADRDKLRGLSEEGEDSIPEGARREIQAMMKEEQRREEQQQQIEQHDEQKQTQQRASAGSMWTSFRRKQQ